MYQSPRSDSLHGNHKVHGLWGSDKKDVYKAQERFWLEEDTIETSREEKGRRTLWKKIKIRSNIAQKVGGIKPKMAHNWT